MGRKINSELFCRNCWLDLLPKYLYQFLKHIKSHLHENYSNYLNNESLIHLLFLKDMMKYPFVIKFIYKHKKLYKKLFSYYFTVLQLMFCNDVFFDKYKFDLILKQFYGDLRVVFAVSHLYFGANDIFVISNVSGLKK